MEEEERAVIMARQRSRGRGRMVVEVSDALRWPCVHGALPALCQRRVTAALAPLRLRGVPG